LDLKLLLKRGALLTAANWPTVGFQWAARTAFQIILILPLVGAAVLVALLLGGDVVSLLEGDTLERFASIVTALRSQPAAAVAFVVIFGIVLLVASAVQFLVKGGTVTILHVADAQAGAIEAEAITADSIRSASQFTFERFMDGCARLFRRYLVLGLVLMLVYVLSASAFIAFVFVAYRAAEAPALVVVWTVAAGVAAVLLVVWITAVNLVYLLLQIAMAVEDVGLAAASRIVGRFVRVEFRELGGVFLVTLAMVVAATIASALAWSGVGLVAFVPLVGLAVIPLQLAALLIRALVFEYISLTAIGAYLTLYRRHVLSDVPHVSPQELGEVSSAAGGLRSL
jgi:hypothetical protein